MAVKRQKRQGAKRARKSDSKAELYFDPKAPASYSGSSTFRKTNNVRDVGFLTSYPAYTMHKPVRRRFKRNRVRVGTIDSQWQLDLSDLNSLSEFNDNYRYLLFCIDVFSTFLWIEPLKKKSDTLSGLQKIFARTKKSSALYTIRSRHGSFR